MNTKAGNISQDVARDFPTIEELSQGFSEYKLEQSTALIGKKISLNYEDGTTHTIHFLDVEVLTIEGGQYTEKRAAVYTIVSPRTGIYFLDFVISYGDTQSISIVIDYNKEIAITMTATLPTADEVQISQFQRAQEGNPMTSVQATFAHAALNQPFQNTTPKHTPTQELVGKRIQFQYSQNDVYEHIYLNDKYYVWHCIKGIEKGLCDTDRCYYYKIAEELYWFTWLEKVVPTVGTVIENLDKQVVRSYGKIFGYETYDMTRVTNFPVGSYAKVLNETTYEY